MHERWSLIVTSPLQTLHRVQHELDPFSMPSPPPTAEFLRKEHEVIP